MFRYDGKSVINIKLKELSSIPDSIRNGKNWPGLNCKTKTGIFGSAIGVGPTGMMANHLQVLQKRMA